MCQITGSPHQAETPEQAKKTCAQPAGQSPLQFLKRALMVAIPASKGSCKRNNSDRNWTLKGKVTRRIGGFQHKPNIHA